MNRRSFLITLSSALIGSTLDPERLLWVPGKKTIFIPSQSQLAFLYGIPYHQSNFASGAWLGIPRESAYKEIQNLVKVLEDNKIK